MLAASLKYKITIEKKTDSKNAIGDVTETWAKLVDRRANVFHQMGTKDFDSEVMEEINSHDMIFTFRHVADFNYDCRIIMDDIIYNIEDIEKLRRREGFKVKAMRVGNV